MGRANLSRGIREVCCEIRVLLLFSSRECAEWGCAYSFGSYEYGHLSDMVGNLPTGWLTLFDWVITRVAHRIYKNERREDKRQLPGSRKYEQQTAKFDRIGNETTPAPIPILGFDVARKVPKPYF